MTDSTNTIDRRYDFALLFDVKNGNPNGDPDAGNAPRIDPETGHGLITDVCLKRKIRNFICLARGGNGEPKPGYDIYVKERAVLQLQHQKAYDALGLKTEEEAKDNQDRARAWMCQTFFDIRMFGAVMAGKKDNNRRNCGQVRGPVQLTFARSVEPILALEQSISVCAARTEDKSIEEQIGIQGRKDIVPYGLYVTHGFINPFLAADTGFSNDDLELLWQALTMMFEHDRSAARGEMAARKLFVFEHESSLGNAPAHKLFERITVARKDETRPARDFSDYEITVSEEALPAGVTLHEKL